jgi:tRNA G18 (ribose-2'-O)-methylase SpoU
VTAYDDVDWEKPSVLIIGNEGAGLSDEVREALKEGGKVGGLQMRTVQIPLAGGVESLNAAAAGAIIMGEMARQRRRGAGGMEMEREGGVMKKEEEEGNSGVSERKHAQQ